MDERQKRYWQENAVGEDRPIYSHFPIDTAGGKIMNGLLGDFAMLARAMQKRSATQPTSDTPDSPSAKQEARCWLDVEYHLKQADLAERQRNYQRAKDHIRMSRKALNRAFEAIEEPNENERTQNAG